MKTRIKYQLNKTFIMKKNRDKLLLKQNYTNIKLKELLTNYVEVENRLKALEVNLSTNDS